MLSIFGGFNEFQGHKVNKEHIKLLSTCGELDLC